MDYVINFISSLISVHGLSYFFRKITDTKIVFKYWKSALFIIIALLVAFIQDDSLKFLNILSYFVFFPMYFKLTTDMSLKNILVNLMIMWIFSCALDLLGYFILSLISAVINIDISVYILAVTLSLYTLVFIFCNIKIMLSFVRKVSKFLENAVYLDFCIFLFIAWCGFFCYLIFMNINSLKLTFYLSIIGILSIFLFVLLIGKKFYSYEMKMFLNNLKINNELYIKAQDDFKLFRHNLNSDLRSLKTVANDESVLLINELLRKYNTSYRASYLVRRLPYGLNGIIFEKIYPYQDDLVFKVDNNIEEDLFVLLKPKKYNALVKKLDLIMDNAISACLKSDSKSLKIELDHIENEIIIKVVNTFKDNLNIDKLGSKYYTTKDRGHGLGLFYMFLDNDIKLNVKIVEDKFINTLVIKL